MFVEKKLIKHAQYMKSNKFVKYIDKPAGWQNCYIIAHTN